MDSRGEGRGREEERKGKGTYGKGTYGKGTTQDHDKVPLGNVFVLSVSCHSPTTPPHPTPPHPTPKGFGNLQGSVDNVLKAFDDAVISLKKALYFVLLKDSRHYLQEKVPLGPNSYTHRRDIVFSQAVREGVGLYGGHGSPLVMNCFVALG